LGEAEMTTLTIVQKVQSRRGLVETDVKTLAVVTKIKRRRRAW